MIMQKSNTFRTLFCVISFNIETLKDILHSVVKCSLNYFFLFIGFIGVTLANKII